jgi:hypothetical protein
MEDIGTEYIYIYIYIYIVTGIEMHVSAGPFQGQPIRSLLEHILAVTNIFFYYLNANLQST